MTSTTTVLAFDFGLKRIGVAVGQTVSGTASPVTTLDAASESLWPQIDALLKEWRPGVLLVGEPLPRNGAEALFAGLRDFSRELASRKIPVYPVDESSSSIEANERLVARRQSGQGRRIRKADVDAEAARVIAERWLAESAN